MRKPSSLRLWPRPTLPTPDVPAQAGSRGTASAGPRRAMMAAGLTIATAAALVTGAPAAGAGVAGASPNGHCARADR